tara:strand:- start:2528 stop:5557 length:3030 start_codon:yes stop_codon:yes gene_type:complete
MDKRRLPATLQSNRTDIKSLNDRANLIKIINNRENALKKRKELMGEYNEIMKRLHQAQMKKKAGLRRSRGGVRTSRSYEKREMERYKRGERRKEGQDEPEIIGEEVKRDAAGNIQITYRDYAEEERLRAAAQVDRDVEQLRLEARQDILRLDDINRADGLRRDDYNRQQQQRAEDEINRTLDIERLNQIRQEDLQLRYDERQRDKQDAELRHRENYALQREFRNRDDAFRDININRDDENKAYDRLIQGRQLDYAEARMREGQDFMRALFEVDERLNRRFDLAENQFRNLLDTNPNGVEIQNLMDENPRFTPNGVIELPDRPNAPPVEPAAEDAFDQLERVLSEDEVIIPADEQPDEGQEEPVIETPIFTPARNYADDLPPQAELRQPRGAGRSYAADLDIISRFLDIPAEGTPERIEFDNSLAAGEFEGTMELINSVPAEGLPPTESATSTGSVKFGELTTRPELFDPAELAQEISDAQDVRASINADKLRIERLKKEIESAKKSDLDKSLEKLQGIPEEPAREGWEFIENENPMETQLKLDKQKFFDSLEPGRNFTNAEGSLIGFNNPLNTPEEQAEIQQAAQERGELTVGTQAALQAGIAQTPRTSLKELQQRKRTQYNELKISNPDLAALVVSRDGKEINFTKLKREDAELWKKLSPLHEEHLKAKGVFNQQKAAEKLDSGGGLEESGSIPTADPVAPSKNKFIPGKYQKEQEVMYYRKEDGGGAWQPAKVLEYKSDEAGEAQLTVARTTGRKKNEPIETEFSRIVPKPDAGEKLRQAELRNQLKEGILQPGQDRKDDKKSSFWEDRDKFIIHNNTDFEFRGIAPGGKSVLNYHKEHPNNYEEHTYYHTPLDENDGWVERPGQQRVIHPKYLQPALDQGLLSLEKREEKQPYKKGKDGAKLVAGGQKLASFQEAPAPEGPGMISQAAGVVGAGIAGVGGAAAGLGAGLVGGIAAQLPTPYEAGAAIGGGVASAGGALIGGAVGLVGAALGGGEQPESEDSGNILI